MSFITVTYVQENLEPITLGMIDGNYNFSKILKLIIVYVAIQVRHPHQH